MNDEDKADIAQIEIIRDMHADGGIKALCNILIRYIKRQGKTKIGFASQEKKK